MNWTIKIAGKKISKGLMRYGTLTVLAAAGVTTLLACSVVYPEMKTAVRSPPAGITARPAPADDLYYIHFDGAAVPRKDQGGLEWPGGVPDPYARLVVDGITIIETPVESETREPTWEDQEKKNYRIHPNSIVFVEVWDRNSMTDMPICHEKIRSLSNLRDDSVSEIWCDSGARVRIFVGAAQAMLGIGLYYETRGSDGVRVTRVVGDSPAARAGLNTGDRILAIQGKPVSAMDALQIKSAINEHSRSGLELDVWFQNGKRHLVKLKEGALYPLPGDDLELSK